MTTEVTGIALSVAGQVRDWSRQERSLAITLRALHSSVLLPPEGGPVVREAARLSTFGPRWDVVSDQATAQPPQETLGWVGLAVDGASLPVGSPLEMTLAAPISMGSTVAVDTCEPLDRDVDLMVSTESAAPDLPVVPSGPFDDFIAAVTDTTTPPVPMAPLPPPSRFMVRVAQVAPPHRATKRNYDYFEELNARLAAQSAAHPQSNPY
jgi:hypothetical protein